AEPLVRAWARAALPHRAGPRRLPPRGAGHPVSIPSRSQRRRRSCSACRASLLLGLRGGLVPCRASAPAGLSCPTILSNAAPEAFDFRPALSRGICLVAF